MFISRLNFINDLYFIFCLFLVLTYVPLSYHKSAKILTEILCFYSNNTRIPRGPWFGGAHNCTWSAGDYDLSAKAITIYHGLNEPTLFENMTPSNRKYLLSEMTTIFLELLKCVRRNI